MSEYNVLLPINEEGEVDVRRSVYKTNNKPKKATFKYEQEGQFCLGVAKVESKEYGKITGKCCPVLDYTEKNIFSIDAYKKGNLKWICKNKEAYFVVVTMSQNN